MSEGYPYSTLEGQSTKRDRDFEDVPACSASRPRLHRMSSFSEARLEEAELVLHSDGSDSSQDRRAPSPRQGLHDDMEMTSSGSSGNDSHGNESSGSSSGNGKDSALLESSESNKSAKSQSPSPPSSSNAFSLLSASSEPDNPSTSGCSSEESAKAKTQKELLKTLKQLKVRLPSEKRAKGKSSTLATLNYALRCVKQVKANEEYYQLLMINESQPSGLDVSSYTIEEIDNITSEYTLKNNDIFAVAVSLITGKIVYISDQAACILNCKREVFRNAKFVEFLSPQDVSVFYSFTAPYRLPSWSMCTGAESSPLDSIQEKSFFCRISGGQERAGEMLYCPFRMTPYLMKVQHSEHAEDHFSCLLLAERVHSGYEAPRIPADKRIFTTTHTPSCMFEDVDERVVPLLGYLPQDLIGTPVLLYLHPSDRHLMLAIHKKILQCAGQPFADHCATRFCARNGEYVTMDTSWSSFVNPWSRKVSFIIGRHTVRTGPVNEDVFAAPPFTEGKIIDSDIQEITEQIHRLLLQPVHSHGSSGYGSLGSYESREHLRSVASSSESFGHLNEESHQEKPRTFQEICKGVHMLKNQGQQVFIESRAKPEPKKHSSAAEPQKDSKLRTKDTLLISGTGNAIGISEKTINSEEISNKEQTVYSYQQISCLESVIRFLDSCNVPVTVKRKCVSSSNTASSNSDEDKQGVTDDSMQVSQDPPLLERQADLASLKSPENASAAAVVGASLTPLALPSKAESVVSITSQCSYSSTLVHVGDKKPQPESEITEEGQSGIELVESQPPAPPPPPPPPPPASVVPVVSQEKEAYKKRGLTKEVLAAHTQQEEQAFLSKFKEPRGFHVFQSPCSFYLQEKHKGHKCAQGTQTPRQRGQGATELPFKKAGRNKKTKSKRLKQRDSSDSTSSHNQQPNRPTLVGLNHTPWSPSETSQSSYPAMSFPTVVPAYPMPVLTAPGAMLSATSPSLSGFGDGQSAQDNCGQMHPPQYSAPLVTPMVAFVLPNYMFPQMNSAVHPSFYPGQPSFPPHPTFSAQAAFPVPPTFPGQPQFGAPKSNVVQAYPQFPGQPFHYNMPMESEQRDGPSRSSTPQSVGAQDQASPPLFQSRCSSPLQLNLLQLEETPKRVERQEQGPSAAFLGAAGTAGDRDKGATTSKESEGLAHIHPGAVNSYGAPANIPIPSGSFYSRDQGLKSEENLVWDKVSCRGCWNIEGESPGEGQVSDARSSSSDLIDILLQEDSRSGTGSAASGSGRSANSGSLGSASNGCGTSGSGTGSSQTSNTSKYFGSIDSSENDHQLKGKTGMEKKEAAGLVKYVLQDPMWLLISNADDSVMMTYQVPSRDFETVLKEDRDKLKQMQKAQPKFRTEQKRELVEVHPWFKKGALPEAIDVAECICSVESTQGVASSAFDEATQVIEPGAMIEPSEEGSLRTLSVTNEEQMNAEASPMP
ncbi:period circadian protein homolog 2-like isoform X2 [Polyodon spathula]|uniref:period circadian protein homolog 2-like isoform X2 n=1 Tax=Polyodon spathula TaxID=7913 RepID=UPI001B7F0FE0|nr:period circadian protein homolog 2-like isoform X2 [Polyodon spathula]